MQHIPLHSRHSELVTAIMSCIPQVCRGIPTRVHWTYSSPGNEATVLAYLRMIPIANENLETSQFLLILYEFKLPPHLSADPSKILREPVVNPTITGIPTSSITWNNSPQSSSSDFSLSQKTPNWVMPKGLEIESTTPTFINRTPGRAHDKSQSESYDYFENEEFQSKPNQPETRTRTNDHR
jgi:hypothetical protein